MLSTPDTLFDSINDLPRNKENSNPIPTGPQSTDQRLKEFGEGGVGPCGDRERWGGVAADGLHFGILFQLTSN